MAQKKTGTPRKKTAKKKKPAVKRRRQSLEELPPIMDRRAMEKSMLDLGRLLEQQNFETSDEANAFLAQFGHLDDIPTPANQTPLEQAQDKMYEAWGATGKRRVKLAQEALVISPDCADAYVLLAEETARSPEEALKFYEQGIQAGERALGPEAFAEDAGHFWGIMETRPYMRARAGAAECLWALGERQQAIAHYSELLRLNPNDNQGNRDMLARLLLKEGMDEELGKLLEQYEEDASAEWQYTRALWKFRSEGETKEADALLRESFAQNRFVPVYLTGFKKPPRRLPAYIGFGDENEAIHYFANSAQVWLDTPGALEWLARVFAETVMAFEQSEAFRKGQ